MQMPCVLYFYVYVDEPYYGQPCLPQVIRPHVCTCSFVVEYVIWKLLGLIMLMHV